MNIIYENGVRKVGFWMIPGRRLVYVPIPLDKKKEKKA